MLRVGALVVVVGGVLGLAGCLQDGAVTCADGTICPVDTACHPRGCVPREQLAACSGQPDGAACTVGLISDGVCDAGVCLAAGCGNQLVEPARGERCDDGNQIDGDGCSASCSSTQVCGNGQIDLFAGEGCDDGGLLGGDGCSSRCRPEEAIWVRTDARPAGRRWGGVSHDLHADELVLFGGDTNLDPPTLLGDTWSWRDGGWRQHDLVVAPPARTGTTMVYDSRRRRHVLFGGRGDAVLYNDTWEWDGATWSRPPTATAPSPRQFHAMVYDAARGQVVLVGGGGPDGVALADTWTWDGQRWRMQTTPGDLTPRFWAAIADDPARGRVVLVGGQGDFVSSPVRFADTWEWDGATWQQVAATSPAGAVALATARFVPARGRVVLLGGLRASAGAAATDTLEWDGAAWARVGAGLPVHASSAFVDRFERLHLVTGFDTGGQPVLHFSFAAGAALDPALVGLVGAAHPTGRFGHVSLFDSWRGRRLVWAGLDDLFLVDDEAWIRDHEGWRFDPDAPPGRVGAAAVFDPRRGEGVVFGGYRTGDLAETWRWDATGWHAVNAAGPSARTGAMVAWDEARGRVLLFGGRRVGTGDVFLPDDQFPRPADEMLGDLWAWDGVAWTELTPAGPGPSARWAAGLAYDPGRDRLVLFGGQSGRHFVLDDTWEFDGTSWQQVTPPQPPPARAFAGLAYDPWRRLITLYGGVAAGELGDLWAWDGAEWQPVDPTRTRPQARDVVTLLAGTVAGDPGLTVFGGFAGGAADDEWRLAWAAPHRAEVCTSGADLDGDGLGGCADPDCWTTCDPTCAPGRSCDAARPRCGDGACSEVESCATCGADCGACPARCGDARCDAGEICPGDCGP